MDTSLNNKTKQRFITAVAKKESNTIPKQTAYTTTYLQHNAQQ